MTRFSPDFAALQKCLEHAKGAGWHAGEPEVFRAALLAAGFSEESAIEIMAKLDRRLTAGERNLSEGDENTRKL
jgi:hypothetical protein